MYVCIYLEKLLQIFYVRPRKTFFLNIFLCHGFSQARRLSRVSARVVNLTANHPKSPLHSPSGCRLFSHHDNLTGRPPHNRRDNLTAVDPRVNLTDPLARSQAASRGVDRAVDLPSSQPPSHRGSPQVRSRHSKLC
jgi:hypothetical protein